MTFWMLRYCHAFNSGMFGASKFWYREGSAAWDLIVKLPDAKDVDVDVSTMNGIINRVLRKEKQ